MARTRSLLPIPAIALATLATAALLRALPPPELLLGEPAPSEETTYREFRQPERVEILGYEGDAMEPFLSRDGCCLMFNNRNDPATDTDLHWAERVDDLNFLYRGTIQGTSSPHLDAVATMDLHHHFYFVSDRDYFNTLSTIHRGRWAGGEVAGLEVLDGVSRLQPGWVNFDVEVSPDGEWLYFVDGRFAPGGVVAEADLVLARRAGDTFERFPRGARWLRRINTPALEYAASISADGRELFFTRFQPGGPEAVPAIFRAFRHEPSQPFGAPRRLRGVSGFVEAPSLSPDELSLYYHRLEAGRFVIYRVRRAGR